MPVKSIADVRLLLTILALVGVAPSWLGCAGPARLRPGEDPGWDDVCARIERRQSAMQSAVYRILWRGRGNVTHTELRLDVLYHQPDYIKAIAKGPFGVPVFTAWLKDSRMTMLLHQDEAVLETTLDSLDYFADVVDTRIWRDLVETCSGGAPIQDCHAGEFMFPRVGVATYQDGDYRYTMDFDPQRRRLEKVSRVLKDPEREMEARLEYEHFSEEFPYWEIDRVEMETHDAIYTWIVTSQRYNVELNIESMQPNLPPDLPRVLPREKDDRFPE